MSNFRRIKGFTLIEALVTVIVMSIGLLGIAALQNTSVKFSYDSYLRTQSALLATDLFDRMRANLLVDYGGLDYSSGAIATVTPCNQPANDCTVDQMADYDAAVWRESADEIFGADSGFTVAVTETSGGDGTDFQIEFVWSARINDPSSDPDADPANNSQTFTYTARVKNEL